MGQTGMCYNQWLSKSDRKKWRPFDADARYRTQNWSDLAFVIDVTALMNELNTKARAYWGLVKAFMRKLQFLSSQLEGTTLTHMQTM